MKGWVEGMGVQGDEHMCLCVCTKREIPSNPVLVSREKSENEGLASLEKVKYKINQEKWREKNQ